MKRISRKPSKIGPLNRNKDTKDWTDAKILSKQYKSVSKVPDRSNQFEDPKIYFRSNIEDNDKDLLTSFFVNTAMVHQAIDKLPPSAAPGPDGVSTLLIKQLKFEVAPALAEAFKKSLENGELPEAFLKAHVKPIKKTKKSRGDPASYRPVSLTSNLATILEHVMKTQLQEHLKKEERLNPAQHGFRPNRSCLTQLLAHYDEIISNLENGKLYDVVYLDFAKAFDTVDRFVLAREMVKIGISDKAATWLYNFLQNRTQKVIAENQISSPEDVTSGVPQGTVLGPQLFLILINSLSEEDLSSRITMFADDTRAGHGIRDMEDIEALQSDLDKIFSWQQSHNMLFNEDKFELVCHGNTLKTTSAIPKGEYFTADGTCIKIHKEVRDLGIQMHENADFSAHINKVVKSARDKAHWVFRSCYSRDVTFLAFMWKTYIQPIMDYGSQLWAPSSQHEIKILEDVFRNFSSRAQQDNDECYNFWDRIRRYGVRSQQRRADRFRVICVWKIMENITPNSGLMWTSNEMTGRHCKVISSPYYSSDKVKTLRHSSFQFRGPALFNALPHFFRVLTKSSVNTFKNKLDQFLDIVPDTPLSQKYHPIPMDWYIAKPSNCLIDWIRTMGLPNRHPCPQKEIFEKVRSSRPYMEFNYSRSNDDPKLVENRPILHCT